MKKIFITLSAIAMIFTSCTDNGDDNNATDSNASIEKTNVKLSLNAPKTTGKTTGKIVQRGEISTAIKDIIVTATKVWTGNEARPVSTGENYVATNTFNLLSWWDDYTAYQTTTSLFELNDVAIGTNDFKVVTTPNTQAWHGFSGGIDDGSLVNYAGVNYTQLEWGLKGNKDQIPYTIYTGEIKNKLISKDNPTLNNLDFNLTTKYGRIISVFTLDKELVDKEYVVHITANMYHSNADKKPFVTADEYNLFGKNFTVQKWSDENSIEGAVVNFKVEIREKGQDHWNTDPLYTYYVDGDTVEASVSKSTHYIIKKDKVLMNVVGEDNIKFNVPTFKENETVVK